MVAGVPSSDRRDALAETGLPRSSPLPDEASNQCHLHGVMQAIPGPTSSAALFLVLNGIVLFTVERQQRTRGAHPAPAATGPGTASRSRMDEQPTVVMPAPTPDGPAQGSASEVTTPLHAVSVDLASDARLARLGWWEAIGVEACQIFALLPGVSRSGITMAGGLLRGLRHDDAARFAFLLAPARSAPPWWAAWSPESPPTSRCGFWSAISKPAR